MANGGNMELSKMYVHNNTHKLSGLCIQISISDSNRALSDNAKDIWKLL